MSMYGIVQPIGDPGMALKNFQTGEVCRFAREDGPLIAAMFDEEFPQCEECEERERCEYCEECPDCACECEDDEDDDEEDGDDQ